MLASAVTTVALAEEGEGGGVASEGSEYPGDDEHAALQLPRKFKSTPPSSGSWTSTSPYQSYYDERQNSTSELYVAIMNHFAKIGGYESMLQRVDPNAKANPTGAGTVNFPHYVATLPEMKSFLEILYTGIPCYSATFVNDCFPRWRQASYARLDKLSLDELRDCGDAGRDALDTIHSLRHLLSSLSIPHSANAGMLYNNDAYHEVCLASLTRQLVDCPFLKARLRGLALLTELIEAVFRDHEARSHFYSRTAGQQSAAPLNPAFHFLTCELLSQWIYDNGVIESAIGTGHGNAAADGNRGVKFNKGDDVVLLRDNTGGQIGRKLHPEVLKRSEPVLMFMASTEKLSSLHIDLLWKAGEDSVQDTRRASHAIFIHLASDVDELRLQRMHELLQSLPESLNKGHVELIKGFTDAVLSRGLDLGDMMGSSSSNLGSSPDDTWRDVSIVATRGQDRSSSLLPIFGSSVELLWKAIQESAPVSREVRTAASEALTEVLSYREHPSNGSGNINGMGSSAVSGWIGEGIGSDKYGAIPHLMKHTPAPVLQLLKYILNCCCQNVRDGKSVLQSFQLIQSLLSTQIEASRLPAPDDSREGLLIELDVHHSIMDMVLRSILTYSHEVRKKAADSRGNNTIMTAILVGNIPHTESMMIQLDFLRFIARNTPMVIPFSTIEGLWRVILGDPLCPDESELFFKWLSSVFEGHSECRNGSSSCSQYSSEQREYNMVYAEYNVPPPPPVTGIGGGSMGWEIVDEDTMCKVFTDLLCSDEFDTVDIGPLAYACFELVFQFTNMKCGALINSLDPTSAVTVNNYTTLYGLDVLWDTFLRNKDDYVSDVAGAFFIRLHSLSQYSSVDESLMVSKKIILCWCMASLEKQVNLMKRRTAGDVVTFYPIYSIRIVKLLNRFFSDIENTSTVEPKWTEDRIKVVIREAMDQERKGQGQVETATTPITAAASASVPSISTLSFTYPKNDSTPVQLRALVAQHLRIPPQRVRLQNLCHQYVITPNHDRTHLSVNFPGNYCDAIILPSAAKDTYRWNPPKDASTVGWYTGTPHANVHRLISESEHHLSILSHLLEGWHGKEDDGLLETWKLLQHLPVNKRLESEIKAFGKRKQENSESSLLPTENTVVTLRQQQLFDPVDHMSQLYRLRTICDIMTPSVDLYSLPGDKAVADEWVDGFLNVGGMRQLLDLILCSGKQGGLDTGNKLHRICLALLLRVITTFTLRDTIPSDCLLTSNSRIPAALDPDLSSERMGESGGRILQMDESLGGRGDSLLSSSNSSSDSNTSSNHSSSDNDVCDSFLHESTDTVHTQNFIRRLYDGVDLDDLSECLLNIMISTCRAGARDDGICHLTSTLESLKLPPPNSNVLRGSRPAAAAAAAPAPHGLFDRIARHSSPGRSSTDMNQCNSDTLYSPDRLSQFGRRNELLECVTPHQNELSPEAEVVQHTMTILSRLTFCTPHLLDTILHFPDFGMAMNFILLHASESESSMRKKVSYGVFKMAKSLLQMRVPAYRSTSDNSTTEGEKTKVMSSSSSPDPVAFFIHELLRALPSVENYPQTCGQYFQLLSSLIGLSGGLPIKELISLCHQLSKCISQKKCCEATEDDIDLTLQGYMSLLRTVLRILAADGKVNGTATETGMEKLESSKAGNNTTEDRIKREIGIDLVPELLQNCLFSPPSNDHHEGFMKAVMDSSVPLPKCKHPKSRRQAFLLLVELTRRRWFMYKGEEDRHDMTRFNDTIAHDLVPEEMFNDNFLPLLNGLSPHHKLMTGNVYAKNKERGRPHSSKGSSIGGQVDGGGKHSNSASAAYNGKLLPPPHTLAPCNTRQQQFHHTTSQYSGPLKCSRHIPRRHYNGYCGLKNLGCICYMNATLQQLFMVPGFRDGVLSASDGSCSESNSNESNSSCDKASNLLWQLQSLFAHLLALEESYYDPTGFCNALVDMDGEPTDVLEQQDADEFVLSLFQQIEARIMGTPSEHIIKDIFGGIMVNELIADGGRHSERSESFNMIKVDVKDHQNLLEGLSSYVAGETVDYTWEQENVETGEKMMAHLPTTKRVLLKSLPESLIIHLKRFEFDFETMQQIKINDRYEFPMELNLYLYTKEGVNVKAEGHNDPNGRHDDTLYTLTGVVVHMGTANSGHYYSIIKERGLNGRWFEFNDVFVTEFDPQDIPAECFGGGGEEGSGVDKRDYFRNAFMLVYDKAIKQQQRLNEEESPCLQARKYHAPIPPDTLRDIQHENMEYWRKCNITDEMYYDFMTELCGRTDLGSHVGHHVTQHFHKGPWPTDMIKLATKYVLGTLLGADEAWRASRWLHPALQHQYEMNAAARNWLLSELDQRPNTLINLVTWYIGHNWKSEDYDNSSCMTVSSLLVSIVLECIRRGPIIDQPELPPMKLISTLIRAIARSPISPESRHWFSIVRTFADMSITHTSLIISSGLLYLLMESVPLHAPRSTGLPPNQLSHIQSSPSKLGSLLQLIAFILSSQSVVGKALLRSLEDDGGADESSSMPNSSSVAPAHHSPFTAREVSFLVSHTFLMTVVGECRAPALQCHAKSMLQCLAYENKVLSQSLTNVIVYCMESLGLRYLVKPSMRAALILIASVKDTLSEWRCDHMMKSILLVISKMWVYHDRHLQSVLLDMLFRIAEVSNHARKYLQDHQEEWQWACQLVEEMNTMSRSWGGNYSVPRICTSANFQSIYEVIHTRFGLDN